MTDWGIGSLLPLVATLLLAFLTRSALIAMLTGTFLGTLMLGATPGVGFNDLLQRSLGNGDFIWICEIVVLIGILFELFRRAGVLYALSQRFAKGSGTRRRVELSAFGMGFVIVDDYFSPLLTGSVMRPMSDQAAIPREKLAFILDATTASVCILVPFTAWGAYVASLIAQGGAVDSVEQGLAVFIAAIPYNFYPLLLLVFTFLLCAGVLPDFGPMRNAERRVRETGALIRPGGKPLAGGDESLGPPTREAKPLLLLELLAPVVLLLGFGSWTLIATGSVKIVEAFMLATAYLFIVLALRGDFRSVSDAADVIVAGAKSVMEALLIVALAYALNAVTSELQAAQYIIDQFAAYLTPNTVVALTFALAACISFSTGTSWGAFALMMPVALPLAFDFSGGEITPLVYQTVAAVAGGGIFGDHASPVSDTSVLASVGAGSDHIDHVVTQLPYALLIALLTLGLYLVI
ncbi:MAG: Na+/H+ antiporter NhaC family protein [Woeseia sp.]